MATTSKSDIEIHFVSLALDKGIGLPKHTSHALSIDLVCPRPTVSRKSSSRKVELSSGVCEPVSPPWTESVALKETVSGRFGIEVSLTEAISGEMADYLVRTASGALVKVFAGMFGKAFAGGLLGDMADIPLETLAKAIAKDKSPDTLARGVVDFESGARFPRRTVVEVPLVAVSDVSRKVSRGARSSAPSSRKVFSKGERIGTCLLALETL